MAVHFVVDIESDGPAPGMYSMVEIGAVALRRNSSSNEAALVEIGEFYQGPISPIGVDTDPEALAVTGYTREEQLSGKHPLRAMTAFDEWIRSLAPAESRVFWSDNPAFDWQWVNYYFHLYLNSNPFGYSARRIGDVFAGHHQHLGFDWKVMRQTKHDHNPLNDARGNAEALSAISLVVKGW